MLKRFFKQISLVAKGGPPFDPAEHFDDPIAGETQWTPMARGGSIVRTHRLVAVSASRMEFRPTLVAVLYSAIFLAVGIGVLIYLVVALSQGMDDCIIIPLLGGVAVIFAGVGSRRLYRLAEPIVFDAHAGYFWRGRRDPNLRAPDDDDDSAVRLDRIHALQILSEHCDDGEEGYYSHELNLVLDDGRRLHVIDHADLDKFWADADELSVFLRVTIWDG